MAASIEFDRITKRFETVKAVDGVSFVIPGGSFFSILGPSGCGKTTLLRLIAGLERPDSGRILIDGQDVSLLPSHKRPVNTVFQSYALFPHLSVRENIAFGPTIAKKPRLQIEKDVDAMLELIQMESFADMYPEQISGGQKQRVAIARALINRPKVLLLDEPLSALDLKLRQKMLLELDLIHDEVGITFVFITHDQSEAMAVSDKIAVLHKGKIEQIGKPSELYESPKSSFVAAFIGDANFFDGRVDVKVAKEYSQILIEDMPPIICFNDKQISEGEQVHLIIRPEKFRISRERPQHHPLNNCFQGIVEDAVYKGDHTKYWVRVGSFRIGVTQPHSRFLLDTTPIVWKDTVWLSWHADDSYMLERYNELDEKLSEHTVDSISPKVHKEELKESPLALPRE